MLNEKCDKFEIAKRPTMKTKLRYAVFYDFDRKEAKVLLTSQGSDWVLCKFEIYLKNGKNVTGKCQPSRSKKMKTILIDLNFKRHVFEKSFILLIEYIFLAGKRIVFKTKYSFDIPHFVAETPMRYKFLTPYLVDVSVSKLFYNNFLPHDSFTRSELTLLENINNHYYPRSGRITNQLSRFQLLKIALHIEFLEVKKYLEIFSIKGIYLQKQSNLYSFYYDELPENLNECSIRLVAYKGQRENPDSPYEHYYTKIYDMRDHRIFVAIDFDLNLDNLYDVEFLPNHILLSVCHQTLESVIKQDLEDYYHDFMSAPINSDFNMPQKYVGTIELYNDKIADDCEQFLAVNNILNESAWPYPYVLFGGPGTGKSCVMVESICQILKSKPGSKILVVSRLNSTCDDVFLRLLKYVPRHKLFRYYSYYSLVKYHELDRNITATSNLRNGVFQNPTMEELHSFEVVVVTMLCSNRFVDNGLTPGHFNYIFIEECASCTEPEALIPLIGLGTCEQNITANVVLIGDRCEVGPQIESQYAEKLGLGTNLLERILKTPRYRRNPDYNTKYVIELRNNYRMAGEILKFPNYQFYNDMMRCKVPKPLATFAMNWELLPNKNFPVILHSVLSPSSLGPDGCSYYNLQEIKVVEFYVKYLLNQGVNGGVVKERDIGILTPYTAQRDKIKQALSRYIDIQIGTVEYFSNRERKIMIISTVRSNPEGKSHKVIGFLKNEKVKLRILNIYLVLFLHE